MNQGIIKTVRVDRGFLFIEVVGRPDMFAHCSALVGLEFSEQLQGQRVQFDIGQDTRSGRDRAVNVRPAK